MGVTSTVVLEYYYSAYRWKYGHKQQWVSPTNDFNDRDQGYGLRVE